MRLRTGLGAFFFACACSNPSPHYEIVGDEIPLPLSEPAADPVRGAFVFADRDSGHCVLCHQIAGLDATFQGNVGPNLSQVGQRLSPGQLRLRIVDYSRVKENAVMPPYYRLEGLNQVGVSYLGETALSSEDVENLVAYLSSLK